MWYWFCINELFNYYDEDKCIIHGIDNEPKWHNYMNEKFKNQIKSNKLYLHNIDIQNLDDLCNMTRNNDKFDIIICRVILDHIKNYKQILLAIINELLSDNGYIMIQSFVPSSDKTMIRIYPDNDEKLDILNNFMLNLLSDNYFGNTFNMNIPFEIPQILNDINNINIIYEQDMLYGGKNGSIGYQGTLNIIEVLIYSLFKSNKITSNQYQNMLNDLDKFKKIEWSKAYLGFITSIIAKQNR